MKITFDPLRLTPFVNTIGPGSVPIEHVYNAGILPGPVHDILSIISKQHFDVSWVKTTSDPLRLTPLVNTIGPGSVPVDHVCDAGILPGPVLTYCQLYQIVS